ncbi:MAG: EF-hand domain-containing protein [Candidatus Gastranaerophilales bacterium]
MSSLFSGFSAGLSSAYSQIALLSSSDSGISLDDILNARLGVTYDDDGNIESYSSLLTNQTFATYLQSNFTAYDTDGDGLLSSAELSAMTSQMEAQGYTLDELTALYESGSSGLSEDTMTEILENFSEIDENGDGRVTDAEVSAYKISSARLETENTFKERMISNMSIFYDTDSYTDYTSDDEDEDEDTTSTYSSYSS